MGSIEDRNSLLWVLFSDANSRFNTLIEECAHLQDTIMGLTGQSQLVREIVLGTRTWDSITGFDRPVACDPKPHAGYYEIPVRDRAFLNLWNSLGGLIKGLDRNQATHRATYETLHREIARPEDAHAGPADNETLYWYLSQRGYFIQTVFQHYTAQLEHAHEKLIQMLENQPGTLPNPILLRRWNSAAYGDFLSEYSRHVNWEAQQVVTKLTAGEPTHRSRRPASITHTWTHQPTSLAASFDVNLKMSQGRADPEPMRFASIRSAYFYVEQPVLLPLLYHECVHVNFPSNDDFVDVPESFFGCRLETIKSLRLAKFPPSDPGITYENFWDHFTEEVWSDAISIALGGRAYLIALALQLFGKSGELAFNHFKIDEDTLYELDQLGGYRYRKYEAQYPELSLAFFWEARIHIACDVLSKIHLLRKGEDCALDSEMSRSVSSLIDTWVESGRRAFDANGTSTAHAELWEHRRDLNHWVRRTVFAKLERHVQRLASAAKVCSSYVLNSSSTASWISNSVNNYRSIHLLQHGTDPRPFKLGTSFRLENVAIDVRWALAQDVGDRTRNGVDLAQWTTGFANWMRNDGGVAFRMALECSRVRRSLIDALADLVVQQASTLGLDQFGDEIGSELRDLLPEGVQSQRHFWVELLRRGTIFNTALKDEEGQIARTLLPHIDSLTDRIMKVLADQTLPAIAGQHPQEVGVGTLTFGVIRPVEFNEPNEAPERSLSPYSSTLRRIGGNLAAAAERQCRLAEGGGDAVPSSATNSGVEKFATSVLPLIGEYQFVSYTTNSTPVERDFHVGPQAARMLIKPRLVLAAGGQSLEEAIRERADSHYARVALIRFRYRWQWFSLQRKLEQVVQSQRGVVAYSLLLSSGWEDVVLVTWHDMPDQLWGLADIGLDVGHNDLDIQSSFHVPLTRIERRQESASESPPAETARDGARHWMEQAKNWARDCGEVSKIYERSGRYDYTVVWHRDEKRSGSELDACARGLAAFPRALWAGVASMITSFERQSFCAATEKQPSTSAKFKAVTHFALRDREPKNSA